ncbi:MAG: thiamine diphosphokinase [Desulfamplus sp.]
MKYLIIANGIAVDDDPLLKLVKEADVVVCADGGARYLKIIGIAPNVLIGDMDSIGDNENIYFTDITTTISSESKSLEQNKTIVIKYPRQKDASDTELAVLWAIDQGAEYITLTGVTGTRMDHTLSNIFLLKKIGEKGVRCKIVDNHNEIFLLSNDLTENHPADKGGSSDCSLSIDGKIGELLSIIPVTQEVRGVTLRGLEYPLNNAVLAFGSSRGVSNVFNQTTAYISIKSGMVLITKSCD